MADGARATRLGAFLVALAGLGLSIYLTIEHYSSSTSLACPDTGTINCIKVTTSAWSKIGPAPVAVLGLGYFVVMSVICVPPAWRIAALKIPRVVGAAAGVVMVVYLIWAELFRVNAICLWCTAVHVCAVALLGLVVWSSTAEAEERPG